jgi:hypothetical protein
VGRARGKRPDEDAVGWKMLSYIREIGWFGMDGIDEVPDGDRFRALVKTVMNLWIHKMLESP